MPSRRLIVSLIILVVLVILAGPSILEYLSDYLWFQELGFLQVFFTMIGAQARLFLIVTVVSLAWLLPNILTALRSVGEVRPVFTTREGLQMTLPGRHQLRRIAINVMLVAAVLIGLVAS